MCQVAEGLSEIGQAFGGITSELQKIQTRQQTKSLVGGILKSLPEDERKYFEGLNIDDPALASLVVSYVGSKNRIDLASLLGGAKVEKTQAETTEIKRKTAAAAEEQEPNWLQKFIQSVPGHVKSLTTPQPGQSPVGNLVPPPASPALPASRSPTTTSKRKVYNPVTKTFE